MTNLSTIVQLYHALPDMLDQIEDSIYIMRVEQEAFFYTYVNRSATRISGITMDAVGRTFFETNSPQMANYLHNKYARVLTERQSVKFEDGILMPNGMLSGESILTPIFNESGQIEYVFGVTRETTERKRQEDLLRYYAYHDDLTKLLNRRYLLEHVVRPAAVYLFDLDHFKNINDTFGHDIGDTVLVEEAGRLNERFGVQEIVVRLGGDEFIVALQEQGTRPEEAAERIADLFRAPFTVDDREMIISASIGVAVRTQDEDIHTLLKQADIALYQAKGEGRSRYHIYEATAKYEHVENFIHELEQAEAEKQDM